MRFALSRPNRDDERILPLINVVFLLLIFFMLVGSLSVTDPFAVVPLRSTSEGRAASRDILVLVGMDGRLALDGEVRDEDALQAAIVARMGDGVPVRVHLKVDSRAEAAHVIAVMELLHAAGVERLKLLTIPEAG